MNSLPDPVYYLQLSETFIKAARLEGGGEVPRLVSLREISSAELASQPNPIVQIAEKGETLPIPVATTLSLGETLYYSHAFPKIGFSTLSEFMGPQSPQQLHNYELGVFQKHNGLPAPTASPTPLELVFCGFSTKAIPELAEAFPNVDAQPTSITLSVLDQFRFLKSQCPEGKSILLIEIANDKSHLFLIGNQGLEAISTIEIGRLSLYETMAEVLHLHYTGSAIKLFTRSGFDSSELSPKLGKLFGTPIKTLLNESGWEPDYIHLTGLLKSQTWFQESVLQSLNKEAFTVNMELLPFVVDGSIQPLSPMDVEILAKVYASLTSDEDFSWQNDYLSCLGKSRTIAKRSSSGSNPPFPTAHPDRLPERRSEEPVQPVEPVSEPSAVQPFSPEPVPPVLPPSRAAESPPPQPRPETQGQVMAIPAHLLTDIEDYEGEFEENDDFGGGTTRFLVKLALFIFSLLVIAVLVMVVFFPRASERFLRIRPPHLHYEDVQPAQKEAPIPGASTEWASSVQVTDAEVASGLQNLRSEREIASFGGLYMLTNPTGATVIVDGMEPQTSPIKLPNIAPGTYDIVISKEGYETRTVTVTIHPKQVLKTETFNLEPLP